MANPPRQARPSVLLDTNIIIYLYRAYDPKLAELVSAEHIVTNRIVMAEALGWPNISADEEQYLHDLFKQTEVLELTEAVFNHTIAIRKQHKIALPDALIAATAIEHKAVLWTANTNDFKNIDNLQLFNPFD